MPVLRNDGCTVILANEDFQLATFQCLLIDHGHQEYNIYVTLQQLDSFYERRHNSATVTDSIPISGFAIPFEASPSSLALASSGTEWFKKAVVNKRGIFRVRGLE